MTIQILKSSKFLAILLLALLAGGNAAKAETLSLYDDTFTVSGFPTAFNTSTLSARWGVWNSATSTFTQAVTTSVAGGYLDVAVKEISVTLSQINNSIYPQGTQMALAIFANTAGDSQALNWSGTPAVRGIFTDSSWVAPSFNNSPAFVNFVLTANTTALVGGYTYNGGLENLALIPEPSTLSLGVLGLAAVVAIRRKTLVKRS